MIYSNNIMGIGSEIYGWETGYSIGDVVSAWHVHEGYPQPAPALCSENKQSK